MTAVLNEGHLDARPVRLGWTFRVLMSFDHQRLLLPNIKVDMEMSKRINFLKHILNQFPRSLFTGFTISMSPECPTETDSKDYCGTTVGKAYNFRISKAVTSLHNQSE